MDADATGTRRHCFRPLAGLFALAALQASAQPLETGTLRAEAARLPLQVRTGVGLGATLTDNVNLSATNERSDLITYVTPRVQLHSRGARVQGWLDYSLTGVQHARESGRNRLQNVLSSTGSAELVEDRLFVDARASISQQSASAFGVQAPDPLLNSSNQVEVRTLQLAPRLQGPLGPWVRYLAQWTHTATDRDAGAGGNTATTALLRLSGRTAWTRLAWSVDASRQDTDFDFGGQTTTERLAGVLRYRIDSDLSAGVIGGHESTDVGSGVSRSYSNSGWVLDWRPSPRTTLDAEWQHRFFGNSHRLGLSWRSPRTIVSVSDSRSLTTGFGQPVLGSLGSVNDLLLAQFASVEPDPVLRQQLVTAFLQQQGLAPDAQVSTGFLTNRLTVLRNQQLAFAWVGLRQTLTVSALRAQGRSAESVAAGVLDDFSRSSSIRQRGYTVDLAHRLTPVSTLGMALSARRNEGDGVGSSSIHTASLRWTTALSSDMGVSLLGRHSRIESASRSYGENAVTALFNLRF